MVGNHVGDAEIHFMAHCCYHWQLAGGYGPGDNLLVEGPQIFQGAPATSDNQCVQLHFALALPAVGTLYRCGNLPGSAFALDGDREQGNCDTWAAPAQYRENVVDGRAGGGGDYPEVGNTLGQRLFVRRLEKALGQQSGLQLFKGGLQCAGARGLQMLNDQLELAAALIQ